MNCYKLDQCVVVFEQAGLHRNIYLLVIVVLSAFELVMFLGMCGAALRLDGVHPYRVEPESDENEDSTLAVLERST